MERRLLGAQRVDFHTTRIHRSLVMSSQDQGNRNQESRKSSDRGSNQSPSQPIDRSRGKSAGFSDRGEAQKSQTKSGNQGQTEAPGGSSTPRKGSGTPDRNQIHYGDAEPNDPRESEIEADGE
jgi:hypothetical protein